MLAPKSAGKLIKSLAPGEPSIDVEGRAADPVLPAHLCRRCTCFLLPQDADDLLLTEPRWPHRPSPFRSTDSTQIWRRSRGSGQAPHATAPIFFAAVPSRG